MQDYLNLNLISENISEHRQVSKIYHPLENIIFITVSAVISGAEHWDEIEDFGNAKIEWLEKYLNLTNGIPSHDTFSRFYQILDPKEFQKAFLIWVNNIVENLGGDFIAIDGKTLRRSYDKKDNKAAIHMVSAWSNQNNLVLGQLKTAEKSNEITAIPELVKVVNIENSIVTIDAMGTQKSIATAIIEEKGDYILQVKGNQPTLEKDVIASFKNNLESDNMKSYIQPIGKKKHGRFEGRKYYITEDLSGISQKDNWTGLKSIGMIESIRIVDGNTSITQKYFICSINDYVKTFAGASRQHWGIEVKLHWRLDVIFDEDLSRIRKGYAPENFAIIKHIALAMLMKEKSSKKGVARKRLSCAFCDDYREKVLKI
jgi:predicted transposase YbfD/YdcC